MNKKSFNQKVWDLTKKIPKGKVTTYKILAEKLGTKAYRAVGQALKKNPYAPRVPCHRVVKSDGSVGGYAGNFNPNSKEVRKKIKMLKRERIEISKNKVINLERLLVEL